MAIAIRKGGEIKKNIEELFAELEFKPGKKVYVKPNLSGREPVLPGENTSLEVMDALVEVLKARDCELVLIGHGALLGSADSQVDYGSTLRSSGFEKFGSIPGVKVINLDELERQELKINETTLHLPLKFLREEVDSYINLAKIKTHMEATVSFCLKNQMGLVAPMDRVNMHRTDLEMTIAELGLNVKPTLNLLEGYPAMENNGPHHGTCRDLGIVAAGTDMVELDSFMARLLGYDPVQIRHIKKAQDLGAGVIFPEEMLAKFEDFRVVDFKQAKKVYKFGTKLFGYPRYSCSRCINAVNSAGREFKKHPIKYWRVIWQAFFSKEKINIIFGKAGDDLYFEGDNRFICVGNCAKDFAMKHNTDCLDKCPPSVDETKEYIVNKMLK